MASMTTLKWPPPFLIQVAFSSVCLTCDIEVLFIINLLISFIHASEPILGPDQPASDTAATFEAEDMNGAEVYDPSDNDEGSVLEEEVIDDPQTHSSQNEANAFVSSESSDPAPAQEEKKSYTSPEEKKSYASIVSLCEKLLPLQALSLSLFLTFI